VKRWRRPAFAAFLLAYFLHFAWDGLGARFAPDDMMNMASHWRLGPVGLLLAQFTPWRGVLRPMGGLFYMPILYGFGLNPLPYHAVMMVFLLANVCLVYRFARLLGAGELAAGLAALPACYHAGLSFLYYDTAYIYDVLCCFFYLAAFVYYARARARGRLLRPGEMLAFLGLYLCALNSKEMAVTLPAVLVAYEWIYHQGPGWNWTGLSRWLRGQGRVALIAAALNLVYLYGKAFGPDPLFKIPGYRPVFSFARFMDFQKAAIADLFCKWNYFDRRGILAIWVLLFYLAWRRAQGAPQGAPRPVLRFCWIFMVVAPLPLEFLEGRGAACLYIPLAGWAVFASVVFVDIARAVSGFLSGEPVFRHLGRQGLLAAIVAGGVFLWVQENQHLKTSFVKPAIARLGQQTWEVIEQLRALNPRVPPRSRVVFLNDPFQDWDMVFIAGLWFRDPSVIIHLHRKTPFPPEELANMDYQFRFENGKLIRVR